MFRRLFALGLVVLAFILSLASSCETALILQHSSEPNTDVVSLRAGSFELVQRVTVEFNSSALDDGNRFLWWLAADGRLGDGTCVYFLPSEPNSYLVAEYESDSTTEDCIELQAFTYSLAKDEGEEPTVEGELYGRIPSTRSGNAIHRGTTYGPTHLVQCNRNGPRCSETFVVRISGSVPRGLEMTMKQVAVVGWESIELPPPETKPDASATIAVEQVSFEHRPPEAE